MAPGDRRSRAFDIFILSLIVLLAVLPFYLPFLGVDLRFVRSVRLLRVFRVAKVGRLFTGAPDVRAGAQGEEG